MRQSLWLRFRLLLVFTIPAPVLWLVAPVHAGAAAKVHVISFGKWTSVPWVAGSSTGSTNGDKVQTLKMRALLVDGRVIEFVLGFPHDVTDRLFVVRRVFRLNDSLPDDSASHWQWQRGGWLLVDRTTGRVSPMNLPDFDAFYSSASWYRDYVAFCGVSDDGKMTYAVVAQIGRRKPVLKKALAAGIAEDAPADSACAAPMWQRGPVRVSFDAAGGEKQTFAIRGHVVDLVSNGEEDEEASK